MKQKEIFFLETCIYKIISKRLGYVHQLFKEAKIDEALPLFSDDFMALYPGFELMKGDKKGILVLDGVPFWLPVHWLVGLLKNLSQFNPFSHE